MKIVFFTGSMGRGGAERVLSILANRYARENWEVSICQLLVNEVGYELDEKIGIQDLTQKNKTYITGTLNWIRKIRRYIKKEQPDIIISFFGRINVLVTLACIGLQIPIVSSERNDPMHDGRGRLILRLCNICYQRNSAVVFQTQYEASCFSDKINKVIIPNPVQISCEAQDNTHSNTIVAVGRLTPQKNYKMLIDVMEKLQNDPQELHLDIYGEGSLKDELMKYVEEKGLNRCVSFHGNVSNIHEKIQKAKVFAMTSHYEGLSNATIEAMMMGIPCVSTEYPGADELIKNNVNGILVPCDDVDVFANEIRSLINDDEKHNRIKETAKTMAKKFYPETVMKKWNQAVYDAIGRNK